MACIYPSWLNGLWLAQDVCRFRYIRIYGTVFRVYACISLSSELESLVSVDSELESESLESLGLLELLELLESLECLSLGFTSE